MWSAHELLVFTDSTEENQIDALVCRGRKKLQAFDKAIATTLQGWRRTVGEDRRTGRGEGGSCFPIAHRQPLGFPAPSNPFILNKFVLAAYSLSKPRSPSFLLLPLRCCSAPHLVDVLLGHVGSCLHEALELRRRQGGVELQQRRV